MEEVEEFYSERKHVIEFNSFDKESYDKFVTNVNSSIDIPHRELLLCSDGGSTMYIDPIIHLLEKGDFSLTSYSHIISSGFILHMATYVPDKRVLRGTLGAFHFPFSDEVTLNPNKSVYYTNKLHKEFSDKEHYAVDFFQDLLDITNAKRKKMEENLDEYLIYDDKKLQKLSDRSLKLLPEYK